MISNRLKDELLLRFLLTKQFLLYEGINFNVSELSERCFCSGRGGGGTPYNGLYGEAPPERVTFFRLQVYKRDWDFTS